MPIRFNLSLLMRYIAVMVMMVSLQGWAPSSSADPIGNAKDSRLDVNPSDWPWWRGPYRNGHAHPESNPPLKWGETDGIAWKTKVPGKGHGSPVVVGPHVYLQIADADRKLQAVAAYRRDDGRQVWEAIAHQGGLQTKNSKSSAASGSVAVCNGRIFTTFLNNNAVWATAFDVQGNRLWQTRISDYTIHQGYGSSPALYQSLVIVTSDNKSGGVIAGLDQQTGEIVWRRERPQKPNYPSAIILRTGGRDQLVMTGCDLVTSLNPLTGEKYWEIEGATTECVTSTVTDGQLVYSSGGYPRNHLSAIKADGSGEIVWENKRRVYVPSMVVSGKSLFAVLDAGTAACWKSDSGEELWRHRLGGTFTSSLILVNDRIYATNESGETFVFQADPLKFELLAKNKLGDEVYATPAICNNKLFQRIAYYEGDTRQEYLVCVGE